MCFCYSSARRIWQYFHSQHDKTNNKNKIIIKKLATTYFLIKNCIKQKTALNQKVGNHYYTKITFFNASFHTYLCQRRNIGILSILEAKHVLTDLESPWLIWWQEVALFTLLYMATTFYLSGSLLWWLEHTFSLRGSVWLKSRWANYHTFAAANKECAVQRKLPQVCRCLCVKTFSLHLVRTLQTPGSREWLI